MLTNDELQAIRARYNYMVEACPSDRGMLERDRYCRDYAQKDIPALLEHIREQDAKLAHMERALLKACQRDTCIGCPAVEDCDVPRGNDCAEYLASFMMAATKEPTL